MNKLLHLDFDTWRRLGGLDTAEEIAHQPAIWRALAQMLESQRNHIERFLGTWLTQPGHCVIFTGAGSSAYIGEIAATALGGAWPTQIKAIPSTSLLTHPDLYLSHKQPTLLVSFARSGNSPESLAAVDLLRQRVAAPRFLNITCNPTGELLCDNEEREDTLSLLMPEGSCDRGFAMTSSFSSMLLAALATLGNAPWEQKLDQIRQLASHAETGLNNWEAPLAALGQESFERIVYLGSGPHEALAKEAALKMLELTGGRVLAIADTPLGFRHGPKSVLTASTLVVMFRSASAIAQRYEQDLLDELTRDKIAGQVLSVGTGETSSFSAPAAGLVDGWLAPLWLLVAQQLALHKSVALGLTPDNPFPDGTVNRVVQGVAIYSHEPA